MRILFFAIILALTFLTAGCGKLNLQVSSGLIRVPGFNGGLGSPLPPSRDSEFVSSSQQGQLTLSHRFKVEATVASATDQLSQTTGKRKYKLVSNIQGEFISDAP